MGKKDDMQFEVLSNEQISKNVRRIVFADHSKSITPAHESGYLKLQFIADDGSKKLRSYTIRHVDEASHHVVIDFVKHLGGLAYPWAEQAHIGATLTVMGPGPTKMADNSLDWFIFAGDLTALPAIAVNLAQLPADAKGYAIIEIGDESDKQPLDKPAGIEIQWLVNPDISRSQALMLTAVEQKIWLQGTPYLWIASEFSSAKALRQYFKQEKQITKNRYVSSYWKIGESDEGNKRAKAQDGGF